jgi:hypothetical protein
LSEIFAVEFVKVSWTSKRKTAITDSVSSICTGQQT